MLNNFEEENLMSFRDPQPESNTKKPTTHRSFHLLGAGVLLLGSLAIVGLAVGNKNNNVGEQGHVLFKRSLRIQPQPEVLPEVPPSPCLQPVESDPCNTQGSYQQCLELEASGCESIGSTRSCPPRFVCLEHSLATPAIPVQPIQPAARNEAPAKRSSVTLPAQPASQCMKTDCDSDASHQQCLSLEAAGCSAIRATRSCPPQYSCADFPTPIHPIASQCIAPSPQDTCHTQESYQECRALEASGCTQLTATASCPPQYGCAVPLAGTPGTQPFIPTPSASSAGTRIQEPQLPETPITPSMRNRNLPVPQNLPLNVDMPVTLPAPPASSAVCQRPSETDSTCHTQATYEECMSLANAGCQQIASTRSCPVQYKCFEW